MGASAGEPGRQGSVPAQRHGHRRRQLLSNRSLAPASGCRFLALECAAENQDLPCRAGLTGHCLEACRALQGGLRLPRFRGQAEAPQKSGDGELVSEPSFYKQPLNRHPERGSGWPAMHSKVVAEERRDPRCPGGPVPGPVSLAGDSLSSHTFFDP